MISLATIKTINFNQDGSGYFITDTPGLYMPPIRQQSYDLASEHFGLYVSSFYGKRRFSLSGWVVGSSVSDFQSKRDALIQALDISGQTEQTISITLANGRIVQISAVCIGLDFPIKSGEPNASQFNAQFEASFPFLVSTGETSANISLATGGGGTVPATVPMSLNPDTGGKLFAVNSGNGIFYPTVRISGSVTNPALRNVTTGKELDFAITLASGEYIDIDFKRKTITDNYGSNRYSIVTGDWWFIQPGTNEIRFLAGTYDASAIANVKYRDSWLGL